MTWIQTTALPGAEQALRDAMRNQAALYPLEYSTPVHAGGDSVVSAHALMPQALFHVFAGFGAMMAPTLPLSRAQHEMIAAVVSVTNKCFY
jgi:hypothetical protein